MPNPSFIVARHSWQTKKLEGHFEGTVNITYVKSEGFKHTIMKQLHRISGCSGRFPVSSADGYSQRCTVFSTLTINSGESPRLSREINPYLQSINLK